MELKQCKKNNELNTKINKLDLTVNSNKIEQSKWPNCINVKPLKQQAIDGISITSKAEYNLHVFRNKNVSSITTDIDKAKIAYSIGCGFWV